MVAPRTIRQLVLGSRSGASDGAIIFCLLAITKVARVRKDAEAATTRRDNAIVSEYKDRPQTQ